MNVSLRTRIAAWCAGLVILTGVVVVLLLVVLSGRFLHDANRAADQRARDQVAGGPPPDAGLPPDPDRQRAANEAHKQAADDAFADVRTVGLVIVAGLAVVAVGTAWVVAGRIVRPLRSMTDTARSIAVDTRLDRRIDPDGAHDELYELGEAFDVMLDRLDASFEAQRSFVADASHELRTPLAVMRAEVDVALDRPDTEPAALRSALATIGDEVGRTTDLIDGLLAMSRAETLAAVEPVDLAEAARRALDGIDVVVRQRIRIESDLAPAVTHGDPVLLAGLVANLVANGATYNRLEGRLRVTTSTGEDGAVLVVENDGPVVEPSAVPGLFERFHRRSDQAGGHGLGLAIVQAIVRTHRGAMDTRARPSGGLRIEVVLPAAGGPG